MYAKMWATILIPVIIIWILYFNSAWLQNILGANFHVARGIITFSLLAVVLAIWGIIWAIKKVYSYFKVDRASE